MREWHDGHLRGILQHVGKEIAKQPGAMEKLRVLESLSSCDDLRRFLSSLSGIHLDEPARDAVIAFACEDSNWRDRAGVLKRAVEESFANRFSPSS